MFNKALFLSLCEKYDVEMSKTAVAPMIKDGMEVRPITNDDVNRIFAPCQAYFGYSNDKTNTRVERFLSYLPENYGIAC